MKDLILNNSGLSNIFWAKIMKIANYLKNKFLIKTKGHRKVILKELSIGQK